MGIETEYKHTACTSSEVSSLHHHHHHHVIQESSPDLQGHDLRLKSRTLMGTSCSAPGLPEGGGRASASADEPLSAPGEKDEIKPEGMLVWC